MNGNGPSFIHPEKFWQSLDLRAGQVVAHLGCGPGFYLVPAAHLVGREGQVIGVDIRSDMLAEAQARCTRAGVGERLRTVRSNLENDQGSTLAEHSVDWVLIANVLHQADPGRLLPEARRIVKRSGTVVVLEWNTTATPLGPPNSRRVPKSVVLGVAERAGLRLVREIVPSPYHYGLLFRPV